MEDPSRVEGVVDVILRFASCELNLARFVLRRDGHDVKLEPKARWSTDIHVVTAVVWAGQQHTLSRTDATRRRRNMERDLDRWMDKAPRLECDWDSLKATYRRSLVDLAALRFSPLSAGGGSLPAAGLPWFMTMFGRDSIFTSLQALPFTPVTALLAARSKSSVTDGAAPSSAGTRMRSSSAWTLRAY